MDGQPMFHEKRCATATRGWEGRGKSPTGTTDPPSQRVPRTKTNSPRFDSPELSIRTEPMEISHSLRVDEVRLLNRRSIALRVGWKAITSSLFHSTLELPATKV